MFDVNGIPILFDELEVLNRLKQQVYIQTKREILHKMKRSGDNIMICCPIHNNGQEKKPSCGVSTKKMGERPSGTVHCFACGYVDTLEGMVAKCFGHSDPYFGIQWLVNNFVSGTEYKRPSILCENRRDVKVLEKKIEYVSEEELAKYRFYHPYMFKRKLTKEIIEKYDIGYQKDYLAYEDKKTGYKRIDEVITFPVRDLKGNCLFISRRSIRGKNFYLPMNLEKPIYGLYELPKDCRQVIICESVFNALTCVAYGRPAVALFGTGNPHQYKILNELPIRKYIFALDPDEAGEKGTVKLKHNLKGKLLGQLIIPKGKDINDLSYDEFHNLPEIFVS